MQRTSVLSEVFEVSKLLTFAAYKNVTISVWRSTPTAAALTRIDANIAKLVRTYRTFASAIVMESADFSAPDQEARVEHGRLTKKYEDKSFGVAMIVDGSTAKHSVYRFVMTTVSLLSAPTVPQKVFPSANAAAGWLVSSDLSLDKLQLVEAISEARLLKS